MLHLLWCGVGLTKTDCITGPSVRAWPYHAIQHKVTTIMQWQVLEYYTNGEVGDYGPFKSMAIALDFARDMNPEDCVNVLRIEIKQEE